MSTENRQTQTENFYQRWKFCNGKNLFQLISTFLLPMMLGVFTIVITLTQQNLAAKQRAEDRQAAEQLRYLERNLTEERYQNELFDNYVKDFAELVKENRELITDDVFQSTFARVRTLNILRQLTSQRNMRILRFLVEAGFLTRMNSLDLSLAELNRIDFQDLAINRKYLRQICFSGMTFSDSTLMNLEMNDIDFRLTRFDRTDFSDSLFKHVDLSFANFNQTKLTSTQFHHVQLVSVTMNRINFSLSFFEDVNLIDAELNDIDYRSSHFFNVRFISAKLKNVHFAFSTLKNVDFSSAKLSNVNFAFARMQNVTFRLAQLKQIEFTSNEFDHHYLYLIDFELSQLERVNFAFMKFSHSSFVSAQLYLVNFSSSILDKADFSHINIHGADRTRSYCLKENSQQNHFSYVSFRHANLKEANFENAHLFMADFNMANLQNCVFNRARITDDQLRSASSIRHAQLPEQSQIQQFNLIQNGHADCQILLNVDWIVPNDDVQILRSENDANDCYFAAAEKFITSERTTMMWQRINVTTKRDLVVFYVKINRNVTIQMVGMTNKEKIITKKNFTEENTNIFIHLHQDIRIIEIVVYFHRQGRMDNLEMYLDDENNYPLPFHIPIISPNVQWNSHGDVVTEGDFDPQGIYVDTDRNVYIADSRNHRIVMWNNNATTMNIVAGSDSGGDRLNQLFYPTDVIRDRATMTLIISDTGNRRVMKWLGRQSELFIENIDCIGLAMDDQRAIYIVDYVLNEVRRYSSGEINYTIVAGGSGHGSDWHQLYRPSYLFVDDEYSIYVSDSGNHRVMKWMNDTRQGILVAGGHCLGDHRSQLYFPQGIFVDSFGTIYIADSMNNRVMRWRKNEEEGTIMISSNKTGNISYDFHVPIGLVIDRYDQMYVALSADHRIQRFSLIMQHMK